MLNVQNIIDSVLFVFLIGLIIYIWKTYQKSQEDKWKILDERWKESQEMQEERNETLTQQNRQLADQNRKLDDILTGVRHELKSVEWNIEYLTDNLTNLNSVFMAYLREKDPEFKKYLDIIKGDRMEEFRKTKKRQNEK